MSESVGGSTGYDAVNRRTHDVWTAVHVSDSEEGAEQLACSQSRGTTLDDIVGDEAGEVDGRCIWASTTRCLASPASRRWPAAS